MYYVIETRILPDKRYAIAHKELTLPEERVIKENCLTVIYDVAESLKQAEEFCSFLVREGIVESAAVIGCPSDDRNENGDAEHITKKMIVKTNMDLIQTEVDKLKGLLEEANSLIQKLASTDLEVDLDI